MSSQVPPKKNTAFTIFFTLYKNDGTVIANPGTYTKKVSIDGAAVANIAASVTEEDTTYGQLSVVISNTEMNGDAIWIYIKDDTTGCVPFTCTLYTTSYLNDDIGADVAAVHVHAGAADAAVTHTDYGNAKLVRSTTPANTLSVDAAHLVAVPTTQKVDVETIKTQAVTCAAGVTVLAQVGAAGAPGANNGLPTTNGTKINQTADLTAGQSIACSDKTGFSLSSTGADLILKSSTFVQAIAAAINELATYGLTAINTLLVTTGIKAASIPDVTLATAQANYAPAKAGDKMDLVDAPNATGISAIVTAINNLATYGLTALNTLLVSTGIKAATIPEVTLAATQANYAPAKVGDLGTVQTADNNVILEKIESMLEASSPGYKFTADALQEAPTGGSAPTAVAIRQEIDSNSTQLAAIVADTNEVQGDLANGGRLDLLIDGIKAKTDNIPASPANEATLVTIAGYLDTEIAAILADTNELQLDLVNGGRLDLLIDAIKAKTDTLPIDPADESAIEAAITAATSPLATSTALAAVKTIADKLDNMIEVVP